MKNKFFLVHLIILPLVAFGATSYRVNNGATVDITEHGQCRRVTNASGTDKFVPTNTLSEWVSFYTNVAGGVSIAACPAPCGGSFVISASTINANLHTIAGSPSCTGGTWTFTINSGVVLGSNTTSVAALQTGTFPSGSSVTLINNGKIYGMGGAGGRGADSINVGGAQPGGNGQPGGPAISLGTSISINNTNGQIFGGGGGGNGGGSAYYDDGESYWGPYSGGQGGGGQGYGTSLGGAPGTPTGLGNYSPGATGSQAGQGLAENSPNQLGGDGGAWGSPGVFGSKTSRAYNYLHTADGAVGAAGPAVDRNGNTLTWLGGNNSANVKGPTP